jgi:hypothetical protein
MDKDAAAVGLSYATTLALPEPAGACFHPLLRSFLTPVALAVFRVSKLQEGHRRIRGTRHAHEQICP